MEIERRGYPAELIVELRDDGERPTIRGHAAVFDALSEDLGGFREKIQPGAFAETIKSDDVRALFNHSPDHVLGRNRAGTLKMIEDDRGLAVEIDPPDTQLARDLVVSMQRGDINQMSFGFVTEVDEWDREDSERVIRTLKRVRLFDASVVTYPAYPQTDVGVRSLNAYLRREHSMAMRKRRISLALRKV